MFERLRFFELIKMTYNRNAEDFDIYITIYGIEYQFEAVVDRRDRYFHSLKKFMSTQFDMHRYNRETMSREFIDEHEDILWDEIEKSIKDRGMHHSKWV